MNAFDTLPVFSFTRHNIIGCAIFGLLFCLTACWLISVALVSRQRGLVTPILDVYLETRGFCVTFVFSFVCLLHIRLLYSVCFAYLAFVLVAVQVIAWKDSSPK